jgi:hypothetical protein
MTNDNRATRASIIPTMISDDIIDLLAASTDDSIYDAAYSLADDIITMPHTITRPLARAIMRAARSHDATDSDIAAIIRDTIRDNCDFDPDN